jgi:large subunit ribosomal protein L21
LLVGGDGGPMVGTPFVSGAAFEATVVSHSSGDKIIVFKFEARKRKRRKIGHRQQLSELRIGSIQAPGSRSEAPAASERPAAGERPAEARPAAKARRPAASSRPKTTQE